MLSVCSMCYMEVDCMCRGLTVMFEILKTYGDTFLPHWWNDIFKIIFRIFDNMKHPESQYEVLIVGTFKCSFSLQAPCAS